jgi:hypothetical protein
VQMVLCMRVALPAEKLACRCMSIAECHLGARLVQLHEQLHEQLHNFNSQTTNSMPNSLVSFSENSLSQS